MSERPLRVIVAPDSFKGTFSSVVVAGALAEGWSALRPADEVRHHRNQDLEGLSKMAFVIMQAVMKRLDERGTKPRIGDLGTSMKLPRSAAHKLSLDVIDLADIERPPMNRIPEYRRKRGLPESPTE